MHSLLKYVGDTMDKTVVSYMNSKNISERISVEKEQWNKNKRWLIIQNSTDSYLNEKWRLTVNWQTQEWLGWRVLTSAHHCLI